MSRAPLGRIILTLDEYEWLVGMLDRKVVHLDKAESDRQRQIIAGFATKVEAIQLPSRLEELITLDTNRNELRYLQTVATATRDKLVEVGRGLRERKLNSPGHEDFFDQKASEADEKAKLITRLLIKAERSLNEASKYS